MKNPAFKQMVDFLNFQLEKRSDDAFSFAIKTNNAQLLEFCLKVPHQKFKNENSFSLKPILLGTNYEIDKILVKSNFFSLDNIPEQAVLFSLFRQKPYLIDLMIEKGKNIQAIYGFHEGVFQNFNNTKSEIENSEIIAELALILNIGYKIYMETPDLFQQEFKSTYIAHKSLPPLHPEINKLTLTCVDGSTMPINSAQSWWPEQEKTNKIEMNNCFYLFKTLVHHDLFNQAFFQKHILEINDALSAYDPNNIILFIQELSVMEEKKKVYSSLEPKTQPSKIKTL